MLGGGGWQGGEDAGQCQLDGQGKGQQNVGIKRKRTCIGLALNMDLSS